MTDNAIRNAKPAAKPVKLVDEARKSLRQDIDPGEQRKAVKAANSGADSFEAVAREWFAKFSPNWTAEHGERIIHRLEHDIFPWLRNPIYQEDY